MSQTGTLPNTGSGALAETKPAATSPGAVASSGAAATQKKKPAPPAKKGTGAMKSSAGFTGDERSTVHGGFAGIGGVLVNLENINIAAYVCDFGNVVVGSTKKKSFRLTNVGKIPVSFNFDKKILTAAGLNIDPDKVQKIPANSSIQFNV